MADDADLVTIEQYEDRCGDVLDREVGRVLALIGDASALVRDIVHDVTVTTTWDALAVGTVPRSVVPVVVSMVRRGYVNPDGFTGESQQGYSYTGTSGATVFATPREANTVRRAVRRGSPRVIDLSADLPATRRR